MAYTNLRKLDAGGMATVYTATDTNLNRTVVIKMIDPNAIPKDRLKAMLERFEKERGVLTQLNHTNIITLYDSGTHPDTGMPYFVMPYYPNGSLKKYLNNKLDGMTWKQRIKIFLPIMKALQYAHQKGVIHRDIKPGNILIDDQGNPILADFGIIKILQDENGNNITDSTISIGTPQYMAVEQFEGYPTKLSDQYSLGVMFYEILTGSLPFSGTNPNQIMANAIQNDFLPISKNVKGVPASLQRVIHKMLAKKQANRYPDLQTALDELEKILTSETDGKIISLNVSSQGDITQDFDSDPDQGSDVQDQKFDFKYLYYALSAFLIIGLLIFLIGNQNSNFTNTTTTDNNGNISSEVPIEEQTQQNFNQAIEPTDPGSASNSPQITSTNTPGSIPTEKPMPNTFLRTKDEMNMVFIPEGDFIFGSDFNKTNETPSQKVFTEHFYIDETEVTVEMYRSCVADGACTLPQKTGQNYEVLSQPVVSVNWEQASAYCSWVGMKLPDETQWEKAARGTDGRNYPWGNDEPNRSLAYYGVPYDGGPEPVGSYYNGRSAHNIYDMAGNAWEWVDDWYNAHPGGPSDNSYYGTIYKVIKGGGFDSDPYDLRSSRRAGENPKSFYANLGFRCASDYGYNPVGKNGGSKVSGQQNDKKIFVPEGEFFMGSDPGDPYFWGAESPKHIVYVDPFYIDLTEVTNSDYQRCVQDGSCSQPNNLSSETRKNYYTDPTFQNYPRVNVTYYEADKYCRWAGGRLPSEAEWEKAARGTEGKLFPWGNGDNKSLVANFCDTNCLSSNPTYADPSKNDGYYDTAPVGTYPDGASPYGVFDMAGNVLEWVNDWYAVGYAGQDQYSPLGPSSGTKKIIRGGSYYSGIDGLRASARASLAPDTLKDNVGFRCAYDQ